MPNAPIVVTNLSGTLVASIGDGAEGMALSANDATLYAATGNTVSVFNTTTLQKVTSYPLPNTAALAWSVAVQSGRLWVGYETAGSGAIGAIDLATGSAAASRAGATAPTASYDQWYGLPLPASFDVEASYPIGFAWSATSEQLFTVMQSTNIDGDSVYTLLSLYPFERAPADLTLTSTATTIGYGGSFTVTAHLGVTDTNPDYSVYQTIAGRPRQLVRSCPCGLSGSLGTAASSWTTDTTYTAVYTGDALYEPKTVTLEIKVGAKVVTPSKQGECVRLEIQQAVKSVWRADATTGCVALNKWSQAAIPRTLSATGWYRVRADFTASAKDTTNVSADSGWLYYVVPS